MTSTLSVYKSVNPSVSQSVCQSGSEEKVDIEMEVCLKKNFFYSISIYIYITYIYLSIYLPIFLYNISFFVKKKEIKNDCSQLFVIDSGFMEGWVDMGRYVITIARSTFSNW